MVINRDFNNLTRIHSSGRFRRLILALSLAMLSYFAAAGGAAAVYTFESLATNNFIDGADGWRDQPGQGQAVVLSDDLDNGTKVVRHFNTVAFNQPACLTRVNDANFDFIPFSPRDTNAVIQFEATGEHVAMLALGFDRNGDGMLLSEDGEIGPAFGVFDRNFRIQEANLGAAYDDGFNEGGGDGNSGNEWYRLQLRVDFTAENGEGAGTLYFMNLSDGDTHFHTISGLRNRPLGLGRMHPDAGPSRWNAIWLHLLTSGRNIPSADNLIPNVNGIQLMEIQREGQSLILHWRGGAGPYQLQQKSVGLNSSWEDVGNPTDLTTATVEMIGAVGYFRVVQ